MTDRPEIDFNEKRRDQETEMEASSKKGTESKAGGKEVCPGCGRHCPADNLHCSKGRRHFGVTEETKEDLNEKDRSGKDGHEKHGHGKKDHEKHGHAKKEGRDKHDHKGLESGQKHACGHEEEEMDSLEEATCALLRKCGHFLHHRMDRIDPEELFASLTEKELKELYGLLQKVLASWKENEDA